MDVVVYWGDGGYLGENVQYCQFCQQVVGKGVICVVIYCDEIGGGWQGGYVICVGNICDLVL